MELKSYGDVSLRGFDEPAPKQAPIQVDTDIPVSAASSMTAVPPVVSEQVAQPGIPQVFAPKVDTSQQPITVDVATKRADEVVGEVFGQAVMHTVSTDQDVQKQILDTARQVVKDKVDTVADKASTESKVQHFKKHEDACSCFGYDEATTNKFHVKVMAAWVFILNTIYIFTVGGLIVAPISFIMHKLKVVIKRVWLAALLALLIYLCIVLVPILVTWLTGLVQ